MISNNVDIPLSSNEKTDVKQNFQEISNVVNGSSEMWKKHDCPFDTDNNEPMIEVQSDSGQDFWKNVDEPLEIITDDNGKPFIIDGELISNNTYELNGVMYNTDDQGRIISAETNVEINDSPRQPLNNQKVDGLGPNDDKGHVIAHILGGADKEGNLVAMDSKLNRGEFKSMELGAKRALEEGKEVKMTVDIEYEGDNKRPKSFVVTLEIDDDISVKKFLN